MGLREDLHFRVTSIKEDDSRWWWWWWWEGLTSSPEKSRRGEEGGVESALGWSIQRDEGRNRGGWMARMGAPRSTRKINRACMCKRHFRRPRDSRSKSARSGSRRRNEQPGQILQRGRISPSLSLSISLFSVIKIKPGKIRDVKKFS